MKANMFGDAVATQDGELHTGLEVGKLTHPGQCGAAKLQLGPLKLQPNAIVVFQLHLPELAIDGKGAERQS